MVSVELQDTFLSLVRLGIGNGTVNGSRFTVHGSVDWEALKVLADRQGLSAVVLDALNTDGTNLTDTIPVQMKLEWIGEVLQNYEARYRAYEKAIGSLAGWYNEHGFKMMVLKGYACALDWPRPEHRPCGDIDIWLFGAQKEADEVLSHTDFTDNTDKIAGQARNEGFRVQNQSRIGELENRVVIDNSHHHHTVFEWEGFTVENHYDFLNVHVRPSNKRMEAKLKELADFDDNLNLNVSDNIYLPSVAFDAIYLLRHCAAHFASTEMTVRQVLDWGFFMEKHHQEIDWDEYIPYLKEEGMYRFYNLMGLFCMKHLGFDAAIFHGLYEDDLLERFSNEIMEPEFKDRENGKLLHSLSVKPRRWWHNRWKNRLCYPDSPWQEFAYGLWAKVLKPSHFWQ